MEGRLEKRQLGRPRWVWMDSIKMGVRDVDCDDVSGSCSVFLALAMLNPDRPAPYRLSYHGSVLCVMWQTKETQTLPITMGWSEFPLQ